MTSPPTKRAVRCAGVYSVDNPDDTAFAYGATVGYDATNKKAVEPEPVILTSDLPTRFMLPANWLSGF